MIVYKIVEKKGDKLGPYNRWISDSVSELPSDMLYKAGVLKKYKYGPGAAFRELVDAMYNASKNAYGRNLLVFKCKAKKSKHKTLWNPYYNHRISLSDIIKDFPGTVLCSEITLIEQVYDNKS